jgi:hypothetical protein
MSRKSIAVLLLGLVMGYLVGIGSPSAVVLSDVTEEPRREAFKAGSVLNEPVLREMAATLKRIESRVEKIEKNTATLVSSKAK